MNRVVHFEIPAADPEKTMAFYQQVFGWQFEKWGEMPYWLTHGGEVTEPGISGAIMERQNGGQTVVNTIDVKDLDTTIQQIEANGGQIILPKTNVPGVGSYVYFKDTEGNIFGAMEAESQAERSEG